MWQPPLLPPLVRQVLLCYPHPHMVGRDWSGYRSISVGGLLLLSLILFFPAPLLSQELSLPEGPVQIEADRLTYDRERDVYIAEGRAVVVQGGLRMEASRILFFRGEMRVVASGDVVVTDPGGSVARGDRLEIDLDTGLGSMEWGYLFYRPENLHIRGRSLKRLARDTYEVEEGRFTTCDCIPPDWSFYGSKVRVTLGEYLTARDTSFYIKGLPVLYSPYVVIPVKRERQTGFLLPRFGLSELRGPAMYNAFFWAIGRSQDATFYLDYEADRGLGKGIQYRYVRKRGSQGEVFLYHYREDDIERVRKYRSLENNLGHPQNASDDRWIFTFKHLEELPYGISLRADIAEVSDDEYFLDFWRDPDRRDRKDRELQRLESNITLSKGWNRWSLVTQFRYFDDLLKEDDSDTLQRLPQIDLTASSIKVFGSPFYLSIDSSLVNFYREEGIDGVRVDLHPVLSLPLRPWDLFEFTPEAGLRETRYWVSEEERERSRNLYHLSLHLQTTLVRIFDLPDGGRLRHMVRPEVSYTYIPDKDQSHLPSFDEVDRIAGENRITYSVTSILTGRRVEGGKRIYHDYLYIKLSQSYDIAEARRDGEGRRPFSEISGELNIYPTPYISIGAEGDFEPYSRSFTEYLLSFEIRDGRGSGFSSSYNYTRGSGNYIDISADVVVTSKVRAFHRSRFSHYKDPLTGSDKFATLETVFGLKYQSQCWGIEVVRTERPDERLIMVTINLLGLGEVAGIRGSLP